MLSDTDLAAANAAATQPATPDPFHIPLKHPYTLGNGTLLTEVRWRRLKARDLLKVAQRAGKQEHMVELYGVAAMLGMIPEDVEEMDAEDFYSVKVRFFIVLGAGEATVGSQGAIGAVVQVSAV